MKKVTILGLNGTTSTMITGPIDIFIMAGVLWNNIIGKPENPYFDVEIVSTDGNEIECLGNIQLKPHRAIKDVESTDLILISSIIDLEKSLNLHSNAIPWLIKHYKKGAHIAGMCTGSLFLAATGLLDGKVATTHWGYVELFKKKFPDVILRPEKLITEDSNLLCSGASNACFDLSLYLVEKYCGHDVAINLAKSFLQDMGRSIQTPYSIFKFQKNHNDELIKNIQVWIEENYSKKIKIIDLAEKFGIGLRTFERRFKASTGDTPLVYIHRIRVQAAKKLLETNNKSFDEIAYKIGYENSGFFREIFKKYVGLCPGVYRRKWVSGLPL